MNVATNNRLQLTQILLVLKNTLKNGNTNSPKKRMNNSKKI